MREKPTTRKARPILITALVVLFALVGYIGAYYANLAGGGKFIYLEAPLPMSQLSSREQAFRDVVAIPGGSSVGEFANREAPQFCFAQKASEIVFWPVDKIDGLLRPERFADAEMQDVEWRSEWWK